MKHFTKLTAKAVQAHHRETVRDSLLLVANITVVETREITEIRVRNLSAGGMMADCADGIAPQTKLHINLRGVGTIAGRVAWVSDDRIGIAFDAEIDPMLARKPITRITKSVRTQAIKAGRPGFNIR